MADLNDNNRLSWGDSLFLSFEHEGTPLNIASVLVFEGLIDFGNLCKFLEAKLPLIPRWMQHIVPSPLNISLPTWEFDVNFDIHDHVREMTLRAGTEAELKQASAKILSTTMDRNHSPWDMTLVHGLKGRRTGVVFRLHHCLADGIAGISLMNVIMDTSPHTTPLPRTKPQTVPPVSRDLGTMLLDGFITSCFSAVQKILQAQSNMLGIVESVAGGGGWPIDDLIRFLPELVAPTDRLPFNVLCQGPQKFCWAEVPLADIKAIRENCAVTVNDVILSVVTSAFRRYAQLQGIDVKGRLFRIVVPVNVRNGSNQKDLGNRISFVPLTLPFDIADPRNQLAAVHDRMEFLKRARAAELVGLAGGLMSLPPMPLQAVTWPMVAKLPISLCNVICTNVPGPQVPMYLIGHKMVSWYPYVPIGGEMGINCAILTYNGVAYVGFTGDMHAAPDLERLEQCLTESFAELCQVTGIRAPQRKQRESKVRKVRRPPARKRAAPVPAATSEPSQAGQTSEEKARRTSRQRPASRKPASGKRIAGAASSTVTAPSPVEVSTEEPAVPKPASAEELKAVAEVAG